MKWIIENRSRLEDGCAFDTAVKAIRLLGHPRGFRIPNDENHMVNIVATLSDGGREVPVVLRRHNNSIRLIVLNEPEEVDDK